MAKFVILHSKTLTKKQVSIVIDAIKGTGSQLIDDKDDIYLFEGEPLKAKEVISSMIGEWSITLIKESKSPSKT